MKKILIGFLCFLLVAIPAYAFLYELKMLTREEIAKLSDEQLENVYIEARIEEKASQEFHIAAGFSSSKDYENRKSLLRYIYELKREISRRENIKADQLDGYLK